MEVWTDWLHLPDGDPKNSGYKKILVRASLTSKVTLRGAVFSTQPLEEWVHDLGTPKAPETGLDSLVVPLQSTNFKNSEEKKGEKKVIELNSPKATCWCKHLSNHVRNNSRRRHFVRSNLYEETWQECKPKPCVLDFPDTDRNEPDILQVFGNRIEGFNYIVKPVDTCERRNRCNMTPFTIHNTIFKYLQKHK